jgi:hypothetical protein
LQLVMLLLLAASIASWTIILRKRSSPKAETRKGLGGEGSEPWSAVVALRDAPLGPWPPKPPLRRHPSDPEI